MNQVVPWGRSFDEYRRMFIFAAADLGGRILGCGDGPASFNAEATRQGHRVVSCDPLYAFDVHQIETRIAETYDQVIEQTRLNADEFVWGDGVRDVEELGAVRMAAMHEFLADYVDGKAAGRYLPGALPSLPFQTDTFDLALCSHFLFLYSTQLGETFHRDALCDLVRVAAEVRVFPLVALGGTPSSLVGPCVAAITAMGFSVTIERVPYEFQRGGNEMLRIRR